MSPAGTATGIIGVWQCVKLEHIHGHTHILYKSLNGGLKPPHSSRLHTPHASTHLHAPPHPSTSLPTSPQSSTPLKPPPPHTPPQPSTPPHTPPHPATTLHTHPHPSTSLHTLPHPSMFGPRRAHCGRILETYKAVNSSNPLARDVLRHEFLRGGAGPRPGTAPSSHTQTHNAGTTTTRQDCQWP